MPSTDELQVALRFAGVADAEDVRAKDSALQQTHDLVLEAVGDRRTGGVQWVVWDAPRGLEVLDELEATAGWESGQGSLEPLRDFLRAHPYGLLIVATVEYLP